VLRSHFHENEVSGEKFFKAPGNSNITEDLIWKFKSRQGKVLISPLPFDQAIKSARLCQGLLSSARTLNDHAKKVKKAVLHDQLVKTRKQLESILHSFENSVGKKIFAESEDIWPHSHADFQKTVYSSPGIQKSVEEVLLGEFRSASSHIKVLCTCPDEVYKLLLKITRVGAQTKDKLQSVPIVNSTRNLVAFTLQFCMKENLLKGLEEVLAEVKSCRKKHSKLAAFAQSQQEAANFNQMLWALYQDMAENPDLRCPIFQTNLGPLPKEGFYTKEAYKQITLLFSFIFFYFNKYSSVTTIGRS
jgi:hypothetical protein